MRDITILSTKSHVKEILESFFWKDVRNELKRLSKELSDEYDLVGEPEVSWIEGQKVKRYPTTSETLIHLGDIKGRRKAINYFLSLPQIFLDILEDQKNDDKHN